MNKVDDLTIDGESVRIHTLPNGEVCIADDGGWIPGVYSSTEEAIKGRENYIADLRQIKAPSAKS